MELLHGRVETLYFIDSPLPSSPNWKEQQKDQDLGHSRARVVLCVEPMPHKPALASFNEIQASSSPRIPKRPNLRGDGVPRVTQQHCPPTVKEWEPQSCWLEIRWG